MVAEFMMTMMDIFTMRDLTALNVGTLLGVYVLAAEVIYRIHENWMMEIFTMLNNQLHFTVGKNLLEIEVSYFFVVKG